MVTSELYGIVGLKVSVYSHSLVNSYRFNGPKRRPGNRCCWMCETLQRWFDGVARVNVAVVLGLRRRGIPNCRHSRLIQPRSFVSSSALRLMSLYNISYEIFDGVEAPKNHHENKITPILTMLQKCHKYFIIFYDFESIFEYFRHVPFLRIFDIF